MSRRSNQFRRIKPSLQARIDYSHPLAPDLLCCPFNELVGPPRDLCHYIESSVSGTAPNWDGARIEYNGNGLHSFGDVTQFDGLSAFTVAFYARVDNFSTAMGVLNKRLTNTSQHAFSLGFSYSGGFPGRFSTSVGNGSGAGAATSYHFNTGSPADFGLWVAVYDSAAGDELRWRAWRNGAALTLGGTTSDSSAAIPDMSSPLVIGAVNSSAPLYFDGGIEYIYAWSGVRPELSLPLLEDPYCFLEDAPRRVYFVPLPVSEELVFSPADALFESEDFTLDHPLALSLAVADTPFEAPPLALNLGAGALEFSAVDEPIEAQAFTLSHPLALSPAVADAPFEAPGFALDLGPGALNFAPADALFEIPPFTLNLPLLGLDFAPVDALLEAQAFTITESLTPDHFHSSLGDLYRKTLDRERRVLWGVSAVCRLYTVTPAEGEQLVEPQLTVGWNAYQISTIESAGVEEWRLEIDSAVASWTTLRKISRVKLSPEAVFTPGLAQTFKVAQVAKAPVAGRIWQVRITPTGD